eukprot:77053-Rhodomonas_salina.1
MEKRRKLELASVQWRLTKAGKCLYHTVCCIPFFQRILVIPGYPGTRSSTLCLVSTNPYFYIRVKQNIIKSYNRIPATGRQVIAVTLAAHSYRLGNPLQKYFCETSGWCIYSKDMHTPGTESAFSRGKKWHANEASRLKQPCNLLTTIVGRNSYRCKVP